MVFFNELRVTPDGKRLIVDIAISAKPYFDNVFLDTVDLNVYSKPEDFISPTPDTKSIHIYNSQTSQYNEKRIREYIDIDGMGNQMFFIYVKTKGNPDSDAPCGIQQSYIVGVAYNKFNIYKNIMGMIKSLGGCEPNKEFIDYFLQLKALEFAIKVGNFKQALIYWCSFFSKKKIKVVGGCNCGNK